MTPDEAKAALRSQLDRHGEEIKIRRFTGTGEVRTPVDSTAMKARLRYYKPEEVVGRIRQGDQLVILHADDLAGLNLNPPLSTNDTMVAYRNGAWR